MKVKIEVGQLQLFGGLGLRVSAVGLVPRWSVRGAGHPVKTVIEDDMRALGAWLAFFGPLTSRGENGGVA